MSLYTGKPKYRYNINVVVRIVGIKRKKAATGIYERDLERPWDMTKVLKSGQNF